MQEARMPDVAPSLMRIVFATTLVLYAILGELIGDDRPDFCTFPYACPIAGRLTPQVGQQGTEVNVLLQGGRLEDIQDVLFYGPGIRFIGFESAEKVPHDFQQNLVQTPPGTAVYLKLAIEKDCPLGKHFLRVRTGDALSEMVSFWVTPLPCVAESHLGHDRPGNTNGSIEDAQPIELGSSVYGFHPQGSNNDYDFFSVNLEKGQRLTVEVWSACLGFDHHRGLSDIAVTVYGPNNRKIAFADDSSLRGMDPILSLIAKEPGTYSINVHQNMDFEGTMRHYVAHISDAPRPKITYPLGGQAGSKFTTQLIGAAKGDLATQFLLPSGLGPYEKSTIDFHVGRRVDESSQQSFPVIPNRIRVAAFANVLEDGGDHFTKETAQRINQKLPVSLNGQILHEGKTDWYRFQAQKGQRYRVRTFAAALGSSLDAKLQIRPAKSTKSRVKIDADDSKWIDLDWWGRDRNGFIKDRMDPVVMFEPDADGEYLIGISDAQRLYGPEHVYRVEFQPAKNHAFIYFPQDYRESANKGDRLVIHRGNSVARTIGIAFGTGNRYRGGMRIVAKGLPPGVAFRCPQLEPGQTLTQATLTATDDAKPWSGLIDLVLEPTEDDAPFDGTGAFNVSATRRRGGYDVVFHRTRRCALAVVDQAPLSVSVEQPRVGLAQSAMIDLNVSVKRRHDFQGDVRVFAAWVPKGVSLPPPLVIPAGETKGIYRLRATSSVKTGRYPITLTARENVGGDRAWGTGYHFVASPPIDLDVVPSYLQIDFQRAAIERQTEGKLSAKVKHLTKLPSVATAKLVRLPRGVELISEASIQPGEVQVQFPIRVTKDALVGHYKEIGCEITIHDQGQVITQESGNGTLRIDAKRGTKAAGDVSE